MPKSWSPFKQNIIKLGSGRFRVVKMFHSGFSDDEDSYGDEAFDYLDVIRWEFAGLIRIELVAASLKLRMLKHMSNSKYRAFEDDITPSTAPSKMISSNGCSESVWADRR